MTDIVTSAEVAQILGVSRRTVHRRATAGLLPVMHKLRSGRGDFLFDKAAIEQIADERKAGAR